MSAEDEQEQACWDGLKRDHDQRLMDAPDDHGADPEFVVCGWCDYGIPPCTCGEAE